MTATVPELVTLLATQFYGELCKPSLEGRSIESGHCSPLYLPPHTEKVVFWVRSLHYGYGAGGLAEERKWSKTIGEW